MMRRESGLRRSSSSARADLVDVAAVGGVPAAPLLAVDRAELAVLVGPFVPDRHAVLAQVTRCWCRRAGTTAARAPAPAGGSSWSSPAGSPRQVEAHLVAEQATACRCRCDRPWAYRARARCAAVRGTASCRGAEVARRLPRMSRRNGTSSRRAAASAATAAAPSSASRQPGSRAAHRACARTRPGCARSHSTPGTGSRAA